MGQHEPFYNTHHPRLKMSHLIHCLIYPQASLSLEMSKKPVRTRHIPDETEMSTAESRCPTELASHPKAQSRRIGCSRNATRSLEFECPTSRDERSTKTKSRPDRTLSNSSSITTRCPSSVRPLNPRSSQEGENGVKIRELREELGHRLTDDTTRPFTRVFKFGVCVNRKAMPSQFDKEREKKTGRRLFSESDRLIKS